MKVILTGESSRIELPYAYFPQQSHMLPYAQSKPDFPKWDADVYRSVDWHTQCRCIAYRRTSLQQGWNLKSYKVIFFKHLTISLHLIR